LIANISKGSVFCALSLRCRGGRALTPQSIDLFVEHRCAAAGLDPPEFRHTDFAQATSPRPIHCRVSLLEAMRQSRRRLAQ
jgi:hypothetical protein